MSTLSRRTFLARSTDLGVLAFLTTSLPRSAHSDPLSVPVGIQLYSVNQALNSDPGGTLKKLQQIGYRNVESAGFGGMSAKDFRRLLDDAGLSCPSAHLDFMNGNIQANFEDAHALGAHYVVSSILRRGTGELPQMDPAFSKYAEAMRAMTLEDAKQTADLANRIGEQAKQAGLQYGYHNHFMEFVDQGHGQVAYDVLLKETNPELVVFEIDCGWMRVAGPDPVHYIRKYPQRFPMIHVKDFLDVGAKNAAPGTRIGTELGHGFIDYKPIFSAAQKAGHIEWYYVEQEPPYEDMPVMDAIKVDYEYIHNLG